MDETTLENLRSIDPNAKWLRTVNRDGSVTYLSDPEPGRFGSLVHLTDESVLACGRITHGEKPWATWRYSDGNSISVYSDGMKFTAPKKGDASRLDDFPLVIPKTAEELVVAASGFGEGEIIWCREGYPAEDLPENSRPIADPIPIITESDENPGKRESLVVREEEEECCICLSEKPEVTLVPCGHKALCYECSRDLIKDACPLCRTAITSRV